MPDVLITPVEHGEKAIAPCEDQKDLAGGRNGPTPCIHAENSPYRGEDQCCGDDSVAMDGLRQVDLGDDCGGERIDNFERSFGRCFELDGFLEFPPERHCD